MAEIKNFQEFVFALTNYWTNLGCIWSQPYDSQMGAGTFHPHTFLRGIGPEPWYSVYVQPCRRPVDGRYGKSTYRFQHYYQLQVLLKPAPADIIDIFLRSLEAVGIKLVENDIALLEDDWKGPTLGAWGLGWEVRANGQEVTQFTYFQQLGGLDVDIVSGEITYGLERLYMYAKGMKSALDIPYNDSFTYGDIFVQNEFEFSHFNFNEANVKELFANFDRCEQFVADLCDKNLVLPAYDYVLQASHTFNLLDARGAISVSERQRYIGRVRDCAKRCALIYRQAREKLGFPMLSRAHMKERATDIAQSKLAVVYDIKLNAKPASEAMLVELGVEEMPPSFQNEAWDLLSTKVKNWIAELEQKFSGDANFCFLLKNVKSELFLAARRLAVVINNLPTKEPNQVLDVWGPIERIAKAADGKLSPAGEGFCKKNGLNPTEVVFKQKADGTFLYSQKKVEGENLAFKFAQDFLTWVEQIPAPLKMRWLNDPNAKAFIRPVRWLCAMVDDLVLPVEAFGIQSKNLTYGQRILSPSPVMLRHAKEYQTTLRQHFIEPSRNKRISKIVDEANNLVAEKGGKIFEDESLVAKCAGLAESPQVFVNEFDKKYLTLPKKLIVSVLREHMNYFGVVDAAGNLLPVYVGTANYQCLDAKNMVRGTQDVVVGRLDDGEFYYSGDLKTPIDEFHRRLKSQMFQAGMGTLYDKSVRISAIAQKLYQMTVRHHPVMRLQGVWANLHAVVEKAALYCKADLKSGCVQEFPDEMQGEMGAVLIRTQQPFGTNSNAVADAVAEHYLPSGAASAMPQTPAGRIVALADKIDSLVMFINGSADVKGNKDPFGLRRNAMGVLRLLGMNETDDCTIAYGVDEVVDAAVDAIRSIDANSLSMVVPIQTDTSDKVKQFLLARLRAAWRETFDPRAVEAVCAGTNQLPIVDARKFVEEITLALGRTGENSLLSSLLPYKRCRNVTATVKSLNQHIIKPELFTSEFEKRLFCEAQEIEKQTEEFIQTGEFGKYIERLSKLGKPLAAFFDNVMVNDKDEALKTNRTALLFKIRELYEGVADFSKIQVD